MNFDGSYIREPDKNLNEITYAYDPKGNITGMNIGSTLPNFSANQLFTYDPADQLIQARGNSGDLYNVKMSYGNYGRINTSNTSFTDPQTNVSQIFNNTYTYETTNAPSNSFAPVSANDTINFKFGVNGSMRERTMPSKTEYYLFNAFDQMKAYSDNDETFGYYGYDDAGQRMYKVTLNRTSTRINALGSNTLDIEKAMLYPNGYINIDNAGNYTKHYYADAARIASKIGSGYGKSITYNTDGVQIADALETMKNELGLLVNDTIDEIGYPVNWEQITHLQGDDPENYEDALFYYHGNHLSSTQLITDNSGSISQAVLYTPNGVIVSEYNQSWLEDTMPKLYWQGKQYDEELKQYYFHQRYYDPHKGVFTSRDELFEDYYWCSPYAMTLNNFLKYVDADGRSPIPSFGSTAAKASVFLGLLQIPRAPITKALGREHAYASNLKQVLAASMAQCKSVTLQGQVIQQMKNSPDMKAKHEAFVDRMKNDAGFIKNGTYKEDKPIPVQFGPSRGDGNGDWTFEGATSAGGDPLTWIIRNTHVNASAVRNDDGTATITYSLHPNETLDLRPREGREKLYNAACAVGGFLYHDILGGNDKMQVKATWTVTIKLDE